jgi:membrane protease YdiL (CAAX protease family)
MADQSIILPPDSAVPASLPPSPPKYTIFRGPNGVRAAWRALIFLAIVGAFFFLMGSILRLLGHGNAPTGVSMLRPSGLTILEGTIFLFTSIAALIMARIEHRHYGDYGLPIRSAFRKNFWVGASAGFLAISASLFGIFLSHGFRLTGLAIHSSHTLIAATLAWTAAFIVVGLGEEFAFRGYLQFTLTTGMGFWPSALLLSALFGLAHAGNPGESRFGLLSVVFFGLLFCLFLRRTGNLWWAVGFHAGWDWGQTFVYGVADSGIPAYHNLLNSEFAGRSWITGGSVGPEASAFTPIVLAIVAILFSRAYRENRPNTPLR